jgi:hypothetical protein
MTYDVVARKNRLERQNKKDGESGTATALGIATLARSQCPSCSS